MKNIFFIVGLFFIVTSCSKEAKLNRYIGGTWKVISYKSEPTSKIIYVNGNPQTFSSEMTFVFKYDSENTGKVTFKETTTQDSNSESGTYLLESDDDLTITYGLGTFPGDVQTFSIFSYDKLNLEMDDSNGKRYVLKKQ